VPGCEIIDIFNRCLEKIIKISLLINLLKSECPMKIINFAIMASDFKSVYRPKHLDLSTETVESIDLDL